MPATNNDLRISMIQAEICWEDKRKNLEYYGNLLQSLAGKTDIAVLPEMFTTGFSMNAPELAEPVSGATIAEVTAWSREFKFAVTGSFIASDNTRYYNRAFFIQPDGSACFYDKRHLFTYGKEDRTFTAGKERLIVPFMGWNILIQVCYDLRFPVWSRNVMNEYDLAIYMASWPESRIEVWKTLLKARALENQAYVCGVNRVGVDGIGLNYTGDSLLFGPKGELTAGDGLPQTQVYTSVLDKAKLTDFRKRFPVWNDADPFDIQNN